ncbi:MAG: lysine--tRNA ligase, partial [Candidatus Thermoplasmatota archaeon]|nr:lysine--tRNA ligase [Candidatus Thermoplasmatota archaeon]
MHWADVVAVNLSHRGKRHIISTGITPSGEFHIGHLREILTGEMISRAAMDAGLEVDFIFIVDDADPLRRVYPFLDD